MVAHCKYYLWFSIGIMHSLWVTNAVTCNFCNDAVYLYTLVHIKHAALFSSVAFIVFWSIFLIRVPLKTGMNALQSRYKLLTPYNCVSTLTVKTKNNSKTANYFMHIVFNPVIPNLCRKVIQCSCFFQYVYQNFIFRVNIFNLTCNSIK